MTIMSVANVMLRIIIMTIPNSHVPSLQELNREVAEKDVLQKRCILFHSQTRDLLQQVSDVQFVKDHPGLLFFYDPYLYAVKKAIGQRQSL